MKSLSNLISRRFSRPLLCCLTAFLFGVPCFSELIPAERLVDWTPGVSVGVPGGIPTRTRLIDVTQAPYFADKTGASSASAPVQAAINAAKSNDVVFLPAGDYWFQAGVNVKSFVTVRGAGSSATRVRYTAATGPAFNFGGAWDYLWKYPSAPADRISGGFTKGSTSLTLASAQSAWVGKLCMVRELNDPELPVISTYGYERMRRQLVRITAVNQKSISIWPPLYWSMKTDLLPSFAVASQDTRFAGVERLSINASQSASLQGIVSFYQAFGCWAADVKISHARNYSISLADSLQCEVRGCWVEKNQRGVTSNNAGMLFNTTCASLIEDNIIEDVFPGIEVNKASAGNVFAYNFAKANYWGGVLNGNHNAHNHYNLWEGNVSPNFQSDGYYGSASEDTLFRNWFHTQIDETNRIVFGITAIKLNRFNRNASIVGNILGTPLTNTTYTGILSLGKPNIGNENWTGVLPWTHTLKEGNTHTLSQAGTRLTASGSVFGSTNVGWAILDRTDNRMHHITEFISPTEVRTTSSATNSGRSFVIAPGPSGWQQLDTEVLATANFKANYYFQTDSPRVPNLHYPTVNPDVSWTGEVPKSLYRTSKPAWFGDLQWPAFDPRNVSPALSYTNIPAGHRYVHGRDPSDVNADDPGTTSMPGGVRINFE